MIQNINGSKSWFSEKINKIDKSLTRFIKKTRERTKINKIRNERREITTDKEIQSFIRIYYEQLYVNKLDNLDKMDKFLETYNFPKLNQKESENLNKQFTPSETEAVIFKKCPQNKALDGMASQVNFTNFLRRTKPYPSKTNSENSGVQKSLKLIL